MCPVYARPVETVALFLHAGFYKLGFGFILSLASAVIIHGAFSYPTLRGLFPDPFFRIYIDKIHRDKHGSDSGQSVLPGKYPAFGA